MGFRFHGIAGFLIVLLLVKFSNYEYSIAPLALIIYFFISFMPDISILWSKKLKGHHRNLLHAPIFWILFLFVGFLVGVQKYTILIGSLTLYHLFCDFLTAKITGVPLFYPFSEKEYSLKKTSPRMGLINPLNPLKKGYKKYVLYFLKDKTLLIIQASFIIAGLISLILLIRM